MTAGDDERASSFGRCEAPGCGISGSGRGRPEADEQYRNEHEVEEGRREQPADYDTTGNAKLGVEYSDWLASAENSVPKTTALANAASDLRITSPLPGSAYLIDPDVRSSGRIPLTAAGGANLIWESESLRCTTTNGVSFAEATEGEV